MAILTRINDILRSPLARTLAVKGPDDYEEKRRAHFERLFNYLVNDEAALKRYMQEMMKGVFKDSTIARMPFPYLNIFRRIIHRLSVVYQEPAERYLLIESENGSTADNSHNERYQELLEGSNINAASKQWNRQAKAFDTCYVQPAWREDHVEYDVFAPHQLKVTVREDNYLLPARIEYDVAGGEENETVIWTETEHWILNEDRQPIPKRNPWGGKNRYGVLPFFPVRLRVSEDHWGEGDSQLADINEKINVLLANTYYNAILQTHGQLYGINFDLKDELRLGPDSIIAVDGVREGEIMPSIGYIKPDAAIDVALKQIDWMTKTAAMMRGLPASSVSIDEQAQSGAAKTIDNQELQELRADDIEMLRPAEKSIFQITKVVWNFHMPSSRIGDEARFGVDFNLPQVGQAPEDKRKEKDWKYGYGLWTPVDDMADEDEGISREQAEQMIAENIATKARLFPAPDMTPKDDMEDMPDDANAGEV